MYKAADSTFVNELEPNERFSLFHYLFFLSRYWLLFPFSFLISFSPHLPLLYFSPFFISALKRIVKRVLECDPSHCCSNHRLAEKRIEGASRSHSVHHDLSIRDWCPKAESDRPKPSPTDVCWTSNNGDYKPAQATTCSRAWRALNSEMFSVCPT